MTTSTRRLICAQASVADTLACAQMKAQAWRESYAGIVPEAELARQESDDAIQGIAAYWTRLIAEGHYLWMALDFQTRDVMGVALAGVGRDKDAPTPLELQMLYVLDCVKGTGIGRELMQRAIGDADAYLWVLDPNPRAQAFYAKHGFRSDGCSLTDSQGVTDIRMVRRTET